MCVRRKIKVALLFYQLVGETLPRPHIGCTATRSKIPGSALLAAVANRECMLKN